MPEEQRTQAAQSSATDQTGLDLTHDELEELAEKVFEILRRELIYENERLGKLI